MTMRLSIISFAGIVRTLVAVGICSDASMLVASVFAMPRSGVTVSSVAAPCLVPWAGASAGMGFFAGARWASGRVGRVIGDVAGAAGASAAGAGSAADAGSAAAAGSDWAAPGALNCGASRGIASASGSAPMSARVDDSVSESGGASGPCGAMSPSTGW